MTARPTPDPNRIASIEALEERYGAPVPRALTKEIDRLSAHYRAFIEAAPFAVVASVGPEGLDCSPRGDPPGSFVRVRDDRTLLLPDRRPDAAGARRRLRRRGLRRRLPRAHEADDLLS